VEFGRYCAKHDVECHLTAPYSLQQNEVVEHRNQSMVVMARCILYNRTRWSSIEIKAWSPWRGACSGAIQEDRRSRLGLGGEMLD
jgi:hypothetical protein